MVIKAILNNVAKKDSTHISNEKRNPLFETIENHQEFFSTKWKNQGYVYLIGYETGKINLKFLPFPKSGKCSKLKEVQNIFPVPYPIMYYNIILITLGKTFRKEK